MCLEKETFEAVEKENVEELHRLLDSGSDINLKYENGYTLLILAATKGNVPILSLLLNRGADIHVRAGKFGRTALHFAAFHDRSGRCVRLLLAAGSPVDCRDGQQWTPLHDAAYRDNEAAMMALLDAGASKTAKNDVGKTPIDLLRSLRRLRSSLDCSRSTTTEQTFTKSVTGVVRNTASDKDTCTDSTFSDREFPSASVTSSLPPEVKTCSAIEAINSASPALGSSSLATRKVVSSAPNSYTATSSTRVPPHEVQNIRKSGGEKADVRSEKLIDKRSLLEGCILATASLVSKPSVASDETFNLNNASQVTDNAHINNRVSLKRVRRCDNVEEVKEKRITFTISSSVPFTPYSFAPKNSSIVRPSRVTESQTFASTNPSPHQTDGVCQKVPEKEESGTFPQHSSTVNITPTREVLLQRVKSVLKGGKEVPLENINCSQLERCILSEEPPLSKPSVASYESSTSNMPLLVAGYANPRKERCLLKRTGTCDKREEMMEVSYEDLISNSISPSKGSSDSNVDPSGYIDLQTFTSPNPSSHQTAAVRQTLPEENVSVSTPQKGPTTSANPTTEVLHQGVKSILEGGQKAVVRSEKWIDKRSQLEGCILPVAHAVSKSSVASHERSTFNTPSHVSGYSDSRQERSPLKRLRSCEKRKEVIEKKMSYTVPASHCAFSRRNRLTTIDRPKADTETQNSASIIPSQNSASTERRMCLEKETFEAVEKENFEELHRLLDAGSDINFKYENGHTLLIRAATKGNVRILSLLLNRGADIHVRAGKFGRTALHFAAFHDRSGRCVRLLLAAGSPVDCRDGQQWTPLHDAAYNDNEAAMMALLDAGASKTAKNEVGKTPNDLLTSLRRLRSSPTCGRSTSTEQTFAKNVTGVSNNTASGKDTESTYKNKVVCPVLSAKQESASSQVCRPTMAYGSLWSTTSANSYFSATESPSVSVTSSLPAEFKTCTASNARNSLSSPAPGSSCLAIRKSVASAPNLYSATSSTRVLAQEEHNTRKMDGEKVRSEKWIDKRFLLGGRILATVSLVSKPSFACYEASTSNPPSHVTENADPKNKRISLRRMGSCENG